MASNDRELTCVNDPNFAIICAFLHKFGATCNISYPSINDLQKMLENTDEGECVLNDKCLRGRAHFFFLFYIL